jgi:hypothetical protein
VSAETIKNYGRKIITVYLVHLTVNLAKEIMYDMLTSPLFKLCIREGNVANVRKKSNVL